jgi:peptidoglycan/LPS O-acetylase OafA/YrhL
VLRHSTADYFLSRVLRIVPALCLVTCVEVLVIGPTFTKLPLAEYFTSDVTWGRLWNPAVFTITYTLPGVFTSLPIGGVNGSLWTLPIECSFYLILPVIAFFGALSPRGSLIIASLSIVGYFVAITFFGLGWDASGPALLRGVSLYTALRYAVFFILGAALWVNRDRVPVTGGGAMLCCGLLFAAVGTPAHVLLYMLCLPYLVIYVGTKTTLVPLRKIGDLSYGLYLFAFPIQQALQETFSHIGPLSLTIAATAIGLAAAYASYWMVESRFLKLRKKRRPDLHAVATRSPVQIAAVL